MPLSAALYENADTGTVFSGDDLVGLATVLKRIERIESALQELIQPRVTSRVVGSLKLDLIKRTAKRGERPIELLPREYSLLDYMMQRTNEVLTRATLFKEVLNYKFVPSTNLVDIHMGRLRRKVDMPNEAPMIECIRGAGFMLRAPV
jgi:two-component system OmpR family response regulator